MIGFADNLDNLLKNIYMDSLIIIWSPCFAFSKVQKSLLVDIAHSVIHIEFTGWRY